MNSAHFLHYKENSLWAWPCDCGERDNTHYTSFAIVMLDALIWEYIFSDNNKQTLGHYQSIMSLEFNGTI
jgi:hypothetical protein